MDGTEYTPTRRGWLKGKLRQIFLQSKERSFAVKRDHYTCQICGAKQSTAKGREVKIQVHHLNGIDWNGFVDRFMEQVLCDPKYLQTLCTYCHKKITENGNTITQLQT
jgi:hypothetical protein